MLLSSESSATSASIFLTSTATYFGAGQRTTASISIAGNDYAEALFTTRAYASPSKS